MPGMLGKGGASVLTASWRRRFEPIEFCCDPLNVSKGHAWAKAAAAAALFGVVITLQLAARETSWFGDVS